MHIDSVAKDTEELLNPSSESVKSKFAVIGSSSLVLVHFSALKLRLGRCHL